MFKERKTKREMIADVEAALDANQHIVWAKKDPSKCNTLVYYVQTEGVPGLQARLRYQNTDIATTEGEVLTIDTDGWHTPTTKKRLNNISEHIWVNNARFNIYQCNSIWYINNHDEERVFEDGVKINTVTGEFITEKHVTAKEMKQLKKKIYEYVDDYMRAFKAGKIGKPTFDDCTLCRYMTAIDKGTNHLLSHFEDKYYVPSLMLRAIEEIPVSEAVQRYLYGIWYGVKDDSPLGAKDDSPWYYGSLCTRQKMWDHQLEASLRRFLCRKLGLAR